MHHMGKPDSWITWDVRTGGFVLRQADLTGETLYRPETVSLNKRKRKGGSMRCRVADESVVVMNPQPVKAGNRPEGKTEGTAALVSLGCAGQKPV